MTVSYDTTILAFGNNAGIEVPDDVLARLDAGKRPRVVVRVADYTFAITVGAMSGKVLIPLSKAHRDASGLHAGMAVHIDLEVDTALVEIAVPEALATALAGAGLTAAFDALAPSRRKEYVRQVAEAKADATRERRIAKILVDLG